MSLVVENKSRIFRGHRVMIWWDLVGSEDTVKAWKVLDFAILRVFTIANLAPKSALKHQSKSFITLRDGPLSTQIESVCMTGIFDFNLCRRRHSYIKYQRRLSLYHSLRGFFYIYVLSADGTINFHDLQIICMTVSKTYLRTFITSFTNAVTNLLSNHSL